MLNEFQLKKDFSHMILSDRVQDKMSSFDTWVPNIKHFYWTMSNSYFDPCHKIENTYHSLKTYDMLIK